MAEPLNENDPAERGAQSIRAAYTEYRRRFDEITGRAGARFLERDWHGMRADRSERLSLYKRSVDGIEADVRRLLGNSSADKSIWARTREIYAGLIGRFPDRELAETFFNSLTRRIFTTIGVDPLVEFVSSHFAGMPSPPRADVYRDYGSFPTAVDMAEAVFTDLPPAAGIRIPASETRLAAAAIDKAVVSAGVPFEEWQAHFITDVFYRGKGAFVIGCLRSKAVCLPVVFALLNTAQGVLVDSALTSEDDVSVLFSFTRSYFHVMVERPGALVGFLKSIMPRKRIAELYIALGFHKHGKTEFYREILEHLTSCGQDRFEISPGTRGTVMVVFNMPADDLVFKLIRDRFGTAKHTSRREVMDKYALVFKHDRAGRLVDAQSFEHLRFERCCFSEELLAELRVHAAGTVRIETDQVIIAHAYVQRRVTPLDVFLQEAHPEDARKAIVDFGEAIRDLAVSNIFAGDFLLKNFGVTRHGRVVFYDYDEICPLTQCNFRELPQARHDEDEMSAEPWFLVGEHDVFPEEFRRFLPLPAHQMNAFLRRHAELFKVAYWRDVQQALNSGALADIMPYAPAKRLKR